MNQSGKAASCIIAVPIDGLSISNEPPIFGKWQVGNVTFMSPESWSQQGAPYDRMSFGNSALNTAETCIAQLEHVGDCTRYHDHMYARSVAISPVFTACNILAATIHFHSKRHQPIGFSLDGVQRYTTRKLCVIDDHRATKVGFMDGAFFPIRIDAEWHGWLSDQRIIRLFDVIRDDNLEPDWRRQIQAATAVFGRSRLALTRADAFLFNIMTLETLLTKKNERNGRKLACRLYGMLGWYLATERPNAMEEIERLHQIRCEIVHDSNYERLTNSAIAQDFRIPAGVGYAASAGA